MSKKTWLLLTLCLLLLVMGTVIVATAEETGSFTLPWWSVDAGGGTSTGGAFTITGTMGQADAGFCASSEDGNFALQGGFWGGCPGSHIYLPLVVR